MTRIKSHGELTALATTRPFVDELFGYNFICSIILAVSLVDNILHFNRVPQVTFPQVALDVRTQQEMEVRLM